MLKISVPSSTTWLEGLANEAKLTELSWKKRILQKNNYFLQVGKRFKSGEYNSLDKGRAHPNRSHWNLTHHFPFPKEQLHHHRGFSGGSHRNPMVPPWAIPANNTAWPTGMGHWTMPQDAGLSCRASLNRPHIHTKYCSLSFLVSISAAWGHQNLSLADV